MYLLVLIALVWLTVSNIQMNRTIYAMKKMAALRIALEVDRDATLAATQLEPVVAKYSEETLAEVFVQGREKHHASDMRNLFLGRFQRLFS